MAKVVWDARGLSAHEAWVEFLFWQFGYDTAADYARLVEGGTAHLAQFPESGSPAQSIVEGRRVWIVTNPKNGNRYKIHYDFDATQDVITVISVSK